MSTITIVNQNNLKYHEIRGVSPCHVQAGEMLKWNHSVTFIS